MPPVTDIWKLSNALKFNEPLSFDDDRYVPTEAGRGAFSFDPILKGLGVDPRSDKLQNPPDVRYFLFCGHRGCGKSTELRRLANRLHKHDIFHVVFMDAGVELDPNDLHYPDVLMTLAKKLFEALESSGKSIDSVFLTNLNTWFEEKIVKNEKTAELGVEIKAGIKIKTGIPFYANLFGSLTNVFKSGSTHKEELRRVIKNSFSLFSEYFNNLIRETEKVIEQKILFVVDGTDRLSKEDSERFFIGDVHQLQQIKSLFIYVAPIQLLHEANQAQQVFKCHKLPMIKITDKNDSEISDQAGYKVLRNMIYNRVARELFDNEDTLDYAIKYSGGSPRELFRILDDAFTHGTTDKLVGDSVKASVNSLASDYRGLLTPEDYEILYKIGVNKDELNSDRVNFMLYNLILLEYNAFWRRPHPVITLLDGYKKQAAKQSIDAA